MENKDLEIRGIARHDEKLDHKKIKLISFISFLMGFSQAILAYITSSYFKLATGTENVGVFYAVSYGAVLAGLLNFHKAVRKLGKANVFYFVVLANIIALSLLIFLPSASWTVVFLMIYLVAGGLQWASLDVILESFSNDSMSGRIRGLHLTILNAGFIFGPFLSTQILERFDFQGVFAFLLVFNSFVLSVSLVGLRNVNHRFEQRLKVRELIKKVFQRQNILRIYYVSFALEFFFALMIIYTPLYLLDLDFSWERIGIIFTAMLVPFVILQYPAGILADKKWGEKELLIASLFLMGVSAGAVYFIESKNLLVWAAALLVTRIGAALIETLRDSYFYKRIDGRDVDLINFFRTAMPFAYIIATGLSAVILLFFPLKSVFVLTGIVVLSALYPAFKLIDNKCEAEIENC